MLPAPRRTRSRAEPAAGRARAAGAELGRCRLAAGAELGRCWLATAAALKNDKVPWSGGCELSQNTAIHREEREFYALDAAAAAPAEAGRTVASLVSHRG